MIVNQFKFRRLVSLSTKSAAVTFYTSSLSHLFVRPSNCGEYYCVVYTVWGAFDKFRTDSVDLDPEVSKTGRLSRDYLIGQIKIIDKNNIAFPQLGGDYRPYGSFARRTKIQPLDDIDLLLVLNGYGTMEIFRSAPNSYRLKITDGASPLASFSEMSNTFFDTARYVNSTKVLNAIKAGIAAVPNYRKADIKRTGVAVTLQLTSRPWAFDIVPALAIGDSVKYFLIPDGKGCWMRTDPRVDNTNVTIATARHSGKLLPTLRLLKYWNGRTTKPRLGSYHFETLALKVFASGPAIANYPAAVKYFFDNGPAYLWQSCPDPKGLGAALDASVDHTTKSKVSEAMKEAATWAGYALFYENRSETKNAIDWWGRVFGSAFPAYGG